MSTIGAVLPALRQLAQLHLAQLQLVRAKCARNLGSKGSEALHSDPGLSRGSTDPPLGGDSHRVAARPAHLADPTLHKLHFQT